MPKMMLGMAASISMAVPTTRPTAGCTSSTSSSAMTSASGTAMTIATRVERTVPASAARAPYWPVLGDHATVVSTSVPRPLMAGHELQTSTPASPNMATATAMPQAVVSTLKMGSPSRETRAPRGAGLAAPRGPARDPSGCRCRLCSRSLPPRPSARESRSRPDGRAAGRDVVPHLRLDEVVHVRRDRHVVEALWPRPRRSCSTSRRSRAWSWPWSASGWSFCTRMNEAPVIGQVVLPGWLTRTMYMLGRMPSQSALAAAAAKLSRLGLTHAPALFCSCAVVIWVCLA